MNLITINGAFRIRNYCIRYSIVIIFNIFPIKLRVFNELATGVNENSFARNPSYKDDIKRYLYNMYLPTCIIRTPIYITNVEIIVNY